MIRSTSRSVAILPLAAAAALVAGCGSSSSSSSASSSAPAAGSSSSTTSATSTNQSTSALAFDSCLAGTWKASKSTLIYPDNGNNVTLSGGAGEVLTVAADATFKDDYSGAQPLTGTAGSSSYTATYTGTVTGKLTIPAAGSATATFDDPTKATVTLQKDGATLASVHPSTETGTYTCTAGSSLVVTGASGGVTTYGPG